MKVAFCEIFIPLPGRSTYSAGELFALDLQPGFIKKIATHFDLAFVEDPSDNDNLCFAESKQVLPQYRRTFTKAEVLGNILPQLFHQNVDLERDEVFFPDDVDAFFSMNLEGVVKARKKYLRRIMLDQRDKMPSKERKVHSAEIRQELWHLILKAQIQVVHCYLTMGAEVDLLPLLQNALDNNITVVAPKTLKKRQMQNLVLTDLQSLEPGVFGTYHPKDAEIYTGAYDLIIVPGLAFSKSGLRLGYGGGYYDTFLADQKTALKTGVCYPFQILDTLPIEAHDVPLDRVLY